MAAILDIANHNTNVELWNHMEINVGAQPAVGAQYFAPAQAINVMRWDGDKKIDAT